MTYLVLVKNYRQHHHNVQPPRLAIDRMEDLIVELVLVENVWCQKQSWSFMDLLCSGVVGFGLRRNLGRAGKEHPPLPPLKVEEVLALFISESEKNHLFAVCKHH